MFPFNSFAVPASLWVVVLLGAVISFFTSYVFRIESLLVHGLMTAMLTSMIALLVFFMAATDHPYCGANAIEPAAYRIVLHDVTEYEPSFWAPRQLEVSGPDELSDEASFVDGASEV
jgi:hypothetical protein